MSTPVPMLTCDFSWEDEQGAGFSLPWSSPWMEGVGLLQGLAKPAVPVLKSLVVNKQEHCQLFVTPSVA